MLRLRKTVMLVDCFVIQVEIPEAKCPKVRRRKQLIQDGVARVFLSNNTSVKNAMNGMMRYGVSSGRNALIFTPSSFQEYENKINMFLNNKFDHEWKIEIVPIVLV
jgi:hypothetical protein